MRCFWRETYLGLKFTLQIIARADADNYSSQVQFAFPSLVLAPLMSLKNEEIFAKSLWKRQGYGASKARKMCSMDKVTIGPKKPIYST